MSFNGEATNTPIKRAKFSGNASADVVALVTGKKIRVLCAYFTTLTAITVKFQSGGSTDITGAFSMGATDDLNLGWCPVGWFETAAGEKLNLVMSAGVQTDGIIVYQEV